MKKKKILLILPVIFVLSVFGFFIFSSLHRKTAQKNPVKDTYQCPMHPAFTSDKPGDCVICGMKLVKMQNTGSSQKEKSLQEVCLEHNCTMHNCAMHVKAEIKPGEKIICPVCGEIISTSNSKVIPAKAAEKSAEKKARKILYYRNPMNPQVTSPVPMKDQMGMDYVAVYEEAAKSESGPTVQISQEKQQLIGVKTDTVKKVNLTKAIRAYGKIAYDPDLFVAQEEYLQALKTVDATKNSVLPSVTEQSNSLLAAAENKLLLLGMSKIEIDELAKKGSAQDNLYLPGNQGTVWAYVDIYEYEIGAVKTATPVEIEADAYPGQVFKGKVISINPVLDPATRTNKVRVEIENPENKLKPEMFVNAQIKVELGEKLALPESAVLDTGIRKIVYLSEPGDILEAREVTLGPKAEGYYEVISGVKEGDIVVTSGNFLVDSESKLKGATQSLEHQHVQ
ncbi:MAG: efflux RND transporter periplasmic adaptor subunit [Candidatus Omnitrophica bacterium]|nr:efflux RND transporter periplasmic adaptor subunit [Candidatus Omnitrophota bacterium]